MIAEQLERIVRHITRDLMFLKKYTAVVQLDHGDGTFALLADDASMRGRGLQRVPVSVGIAGARVASAEPGTRCLFGFDDGMPSSPRIEAWAFQRGAATVRFDDGDGGIARKGDLIDVNLNEPTSLAGVIIAGAVTPPASSPVPIPPGTPINITATLGVPVRARIVGGARRVAA
jgi:hypothetical protein